METIYYDYSDMVADLNNIKHQIDEHTKNEKFKFDAIIGIARGGAIPAVVLSHMLSIPCHIITWSVSEYPYTRIASREARSIINDSSKNILLVDDIIDKGDMFFDFLQFFFTSEKPERAKIACLIYNTSQSLVNTDYCGRQIDRRETPQWFDFWWEQVGEKE